jgi:predicted ribosome quality control (RQC) complex YloA/Tae2 family protein
MSICRRFINFRFSDNLKMLRRNRRRQDRKEQERRVINTNKSESNSFIHSSSVVSEGKSEIASSRNPERKILSNVGSSIVSCHHPIGGDNYRLNFDTDAKIRIRGKDNQFEFKHGNLNITLNEHQKQMVKKKGLKKAYDRLRSLDILQKERAERTRFEIEKVKQKMQEEQQQSMIKRREIMSKKREIGKFSD